MARPTHPLLLATFATTVLLLAHPAAATEYPDGIAHHWNITFADYLHQFFTWFAITAPPPIVVSLFFRRELRKTHAYRRSLAEVSAATVIYLVLAFFWSALYPNRPHPLLPDNLGGGFGWTLGTSVGLALLTMPATPLIIIRTKYLLQSIRLPTSNKRGFDPIMPHSPPSTAATERSSRPDLS